MIIHLDFGDLAMIKVLFFLLPWICGFALFKKVVLNVKEGYTGNDRISVIIPARNEKKNLPNILASLREQTLKPYEIIVCDDHSTDGTDEIAKSFGVTVIKSPPLPENWTGKNWAVWNGFLNSSGEILVFLDADVTLKKRALEVLVSTREKSKGVISVVPFHYTRKFYERLSMVLYLLGVFVFTSPFERKNKNKGLYGSCIVATRADYEKINGHSGVSFELLDDLNLGKRFLDFDIPVKNYIGCGQVAFRMYPNGIWGEIYGFGKGAVLSTSNLMPSTMSLTVLWVLGLLVTGFGTPILILLHQPSAIFFLVGYLFYTFQFFYFLHYTGRYGWFIPIFHFISSAFFIFVILYSFYRVTFVGSVSWKGREIKVGRKGE